MSQLKGDRGRFVISRQAFLTSDFEPCKFLAPRPCRTVYHSAQPSGEPMRQVGEGWRGRRWKSPSGMPTVAHNTRSKTKSSFRSAIFLGHFPTWPHADVVGEQG